MSRKNEIPIYAPDGTPQGYRSPEAARRLLQAGFVTAVYGRKRHLKAIFMRREDGSNPVQRDVRPGTRYSYQQRLDNGLRCWKLKRLDRRDEDGVAIDGRAEFLQVVRDCLTP